ncbi:putative AIM2 family protein C30D10.14 [Pseudolycoriella hygida]|uniref:AIM2 family protein C30D10.14 n=1 Tax=Pseudolycoriella hygida TaxID=35572 RepID=A0A9Q0N340_9DIPT|nr:putative AIM2 family protein C30D10.14 [Pseudolycoriella hygida]
MFSYKIWLFVASLATITYCNVIYDPELLPHACAENKAVEGDYIPRGRVINIGNLPVYEAPDNVNRRRMLIGVYDIFGFANSNMKQITDHMALQAGGFRAVLPDFFRGDNWDLNTPIDPVQLAAWLQRVGDWNSIIRPDLINIVQYYRSQGVEEFAIFGMCWGGQIGALSAIELSDYFKASAIVHPSFVTNDQAPSVRIPMYLMPSRDEPDMLPFYQVLRINFGDNSGHRRFDDMFHGFAAARGNFSDPLNQMHVNEVIATLGVFYERILYNSA